MKINIKDLKGKSTNERIKFLRKYFKLTQKDLAEKLNISLNDYRKIENDENIRTQIVLDIAFMLKIEPEILLTPYIYLDYIKEPVLTKYAKKEIELTEIEKDAIIQVRHLKREEQTNNFLKATY